MFAPVLRSGSVAPAGARCDLALAEGPQAPHPSVRGSGCRFSDRAPQRQCGGTLWGRRGSLGQGPWVPAFLLPLLNQPLQPALQRVLLSFIYLHFMRGVYLNTRLPAVTSLQI